MKVLTIRLITVIIMIFNYQFIHCGCCKCCRTRIWNDNKSTESTPPIKSKKSNNKKTILTTQKETKTSDIKTSKDIIEISEKIDSDEQKSEDLKSINSGDLNSESYKYSHLTQEKFNNLDNKNNEEPIVQNDADNKNGSDTESNKNLCKIIEEPYNSDNESDENLNITEKSPENSQKEFIQANLKLDIENFFKISSTKAKKSSGQIIYNCKNYINNKINNAVTYSIDEGLIERFSIIIEYTDKKGKGKWYYKIVTDKNEINNTKGDISIQFTKDNTNIKKTTYIISKSIT